LKICISKNSVFQEQNIFSQKLTKNQPRKFFFDDSYGSAPLPTPQGSVLFASPLLDDPDSAFSLSFDDFVLQRAGTNIHLEDDFNQCD